jgi:pullulanase/glycogen debranching enzyme
MTDTDWHDSGLRAIAVHMDGAPSRASDNGDLLVVFNADDAGQQMTLPAPPQGTTWQVVCDTAGRAPPAPQPGLAAGDVLPVAPRCTVLLESKAP